MGNSHGRQTKVKFGVPLTEAFKGDTVPHQLVDILVHIGREGIGTNDLFRRPGSQADLKVIMKRLSEGQEISLADYNFYTLASVIKKFLLRIPGGVFGPDVEMQLLETLDIEDRLKQLKAIQSIIASLAPAVQQLLALLFGTWFWVVNHSDCKSRSSESVAKSIAGSLFHTCSDDPEKVASAVGVLEILINNFGMDDMFGRENIKYFIEVMRSAGADDLVRNKMAGMSCGARDESMQRSITESEFCCHLQPITSSTRASLGGSSVEIPLAQSLSFETSNESLEQKIHYRELDASYNPHRKLTRVSSISAPDVNQECSCPRSTKYDSVRRRQMLRLKERSFWFLSPSTKNTSTTSSSSGTGRSFSVSPGSPSKHQVPYESSGNVPRNSRKVEFLPQALQPSPLSADGVRLHPTKLIAQNLLGKYSEQGSPASILPELDEDATLLKDRKIVQIHEQDVEKEWGHWKQGIVH